MKKILCLILFVASCLSVEAQYVGIPRKIVGPSGSKVDVSDGNVGINAGSGGAVNVTNGDVYVPTLINFSPCPSCAVSANPGASFRYNSSATRMEVSINGAAYVALGGSGGLASTDIDTSAELAAILGDETGTGVFVLNLSPALTTPKITTGIQDINGNSMLAFVATASAVDGFTFTNAATANPATVTMAATGSDANIGIKLLMKGAPGGTGLVIGNTGNTNEYDFSSTSANFAVNANGFTLSLTSTSTLATISTNSKPLLLAPSNGIIQIGSSSTAIKENAAGVIEIDSGVAGTYRDLILRNITVGGSSGTQVKLIRSATATLDFTSTAAQTSAELSITLTGAVDGDNVIVSPPNGSNNANTCFTARVSAADTVQVKFNNFSSGAVDPASGTFRVSLIQF